jgi:hypothetical protein
MIWNSFKSGWINGTPNNPKTMPAAPATAPAACVPLSKLSPFFSAFLTSSEFDLTVC